MQRISVRPLSLPLFHLKVAEYFKNFIDPKVVLSVRQSLLCPNARHPVQKFPSKFRPDEFQNFISSFLKASALEASDFYRLARIQ